MTKMNKIEIIAEIGQNWCGDIELARFMIGEAKANGADYAKFQLFDSVKLYGEHRDTELSRKRAEYLFECGNKWDIEVFFSVFDVERVKWCEEIGVKRYKIACSQHNNREFVQHIHSVGKPMIVSIPYGTKPKFYNSTWVCNINYLYCIPEYPTQIKDINMWRMFAFFDGFSDHTIGLDAAKIAMSRGAKIIEKHFAVDHNTGVDAPWSMIPEELKELRRFADSVEECI